MNAAMKNRDFIIISLNPWYTPLSSTSKRIATELSKNNRVLYINPPLDRKTILTRRHDSLLEKHINVIRGTEDPMVQIAPNFWNYYPKTVLESVNWIPSTRIFSLFNYLNNKKIAKYIQAAAEELDFSNYILINDKDLFRGFYLKELLQPDTYLYYDRDYILAVDYWRKHGVTLEPQLAQKSDLIVTHSDYLMGLLKPYNKNIFNVGSGIDISMFDSSKEYLVPDELKTLKGPLLGYVGALTSARLDEDAFIQIARQRPDWTLVLVGPEDEVFKNSELHSLKNVNFCGRKQLEEIPSYINAMTVCLNPQVINDITIGNYPLKIDEYLALGKPVVATKTLGMKPFEDYTYLVEPKGDYIKQIEKAIQENSFDQSKRRIALARSHNWSCIVKNIFEAISESKTKYGSGHQN